MAIFHYRALKAGGGIAEGRLEANGRQEAFRQLDAQGLQPIELRKSEGADAAAGATGITSVTGAIGSTGAAGVTDAARRELVPGFRRTRVPFYALESFTRQLSSLLTAGVSLSRALHVLQKEAALPAAREQWKQIHDKVVDGAGLADAMARSPQTFPAVYVAMVRAGETGGFLDLVLSQIAEFQTREKELRARVFTALIYPLVLLALAIGVLIFLLVFFIPKFQLIFQGFGGDLPLLTQVIVGASAVVKKYGLLLLGAIALAWVVFRQWLESAAGRRQWQRTVLALPLLGPLLARFAMTRFCRMLGTLTEAGVPLIAALKVARESLGNQTLTDAINGAIERVQQGESLAASLRDCPALFSGSTVEMVLVAEESGNLGKELIRLAAVAESDLDRQLKVAVSLAEPLMLFCMAAFIGTIFIGMVLPIFTIQDYIK